MNRRSQCLPRAGEGLAIREVAYSRTESRFLDMRLMKNQILSSELLNEMVIERDSASPTPPMPEIGNSFIDSSMWKWENQNEGPGWE